MKKFVMVLAFAVALLGASLVITGSGGGKAVVKVANAQGVGFTDLAGHWAQGAVVTAVAKGYVDGYQDGTFKPEQQVTRAEFVKLVVTALKLQVGASNMSPWYIPYTTAADEAGIHAVSDFPSGDWNTAITRHEMARIAMRAAGQITDEEKKWMYLATKAGIITGFPGGVLGEDKTTTRAQSVTVIERILTVKDGGTLEIDKVAMSYAEVAFHGTNGESVFGKKFVEFPQQLDASSDVDMSIDKVLVVDLSKSEGAYRSWFPEVFTGENDTSSNYLFAYHLVANNKLAVPNSFFTVRMNMHDFYQPYLEAIVPQKIIDQGKSPINYFNIDLGTLGSSDGWICYVGKKSHVDDILLSKKLLLLRLTYAKDTARADHEIKVTTE